MSERHDSMQTTANGLSTHPAEPNDEGGAVSEQSTPWYQACAASAVPGLSSLAAAALVSMPDLITLVYGGGKGH